MEAGYRPQCWPVCSFLLASASCYVLHSSLFLTVRSNWPLDLLPVRLCQYNNAETWDFLWYLPFLLFAYQCVPISIPRMVCGGSGVACHSSLGLRIQRDSVNYLALSLHVLGAVRCDYCKTCLTFPGILSTNAFIYFKEYEDDEQSLTHPPERLIETVSASVTVVGGMMADVAHAHSVEEKITAAIKNTIDFGWIQSSGCSLHHQEIVDGNAESVTRISIPWWFKWRNRSLMEASRQRATRSKHVNQLESNASLFSCITSFWGCMCVTSYLT